MTRDPYSALAELAERELRLAAAGDLEAVSEVQRERAELVASLPPLPPDTAAAALQRAAAAQAGVTDELERRMRATGEELGQVDLGRRAARSYGGPGQGSPSFDHAV